MKTGMIKYKLSIPFPINEDNEYIIAQAKVIIEDTIKSDLITLLMDQRQYVIKLSHYKLENINKELGEQKISIDLLITLKDPYETKVGEYLDKSIFKTNENIIRTDNNNKTMLFEQTIFGWLRKE